MSPDAVDPPPPADPTHPDDGAAAADPAPSVDSAASVDPALSVDSAASVDPVAAADPAASVDSEAADDPAASVDGADAAAELRRVRGEIERVDRAIVGLIAERVGLARQVGPLKQALGMPILDPPREAAIVRRAAELAREAGLPADDVRYVFWHLVGLSRRVQLEEG
jgi:chorismate mutase